MKGLLAVLAGLALAGCADIRAARRAQDPDARRDGERSVPAESLGLGSGTQLSVDQGVRIALKNNPIVAISRARVERNEAVLEQVSAGYLPQISFGADYRWEKSGGAGNGTRSGSKIGRNSGIIQTHGGNVGVSQLLYDFGRLDARRRQAYALFSAAHADLASSENDTVFNFRQAFYNVLKQEELVRVGEETVRQFEKRLEQVRGFVEAGSRQKYDLTKAQVDLGNAQLTLVKARTALTVAKATLNNALGLASDPLYGLEHPGAATAWALSFADAVESARVYHPQLQAQLLRENAARAAIDGAIADFYPSFSLTGAFSWGGSMTPVVWSSFLGPAVNWVLYSGGERVGALHAAVADLREAYAARALEEQAIFLDLRNAYAVLEDTRESLRIVSLTVQQATETLELVTGRYQVGKASSVELTDAQVQLATAKAQEIQARYDYEISIAAIERSIGGNRKP
ncbi:MAG: TolC family protein [Planctomycetaceae bacterium]|nr:TolC family protein [Planctomycetaceae bacterium]